MKRCNTCKMDKPLANYYKHPTSKDGRTCKCMECSRDCQRKPVPGIVYIMTNEVYPDWVKIGRTVDVQHRMNQYNTYSPYRDWELRYSIEVESTYEYEQYFKDNYDDSIHEWYNISVAEAIDAINLIKCAQLGNI